MKKTLFVLVLLSLVFPFANAARSGDCICKLMPMYAVDATNWLHYAAVNKTSPSGCIYQYPTSRIGPPKYGESCSTSPMCGTCSALDAVPVPVAAFELYYGAPNTNPLPYDSFETDVKIKGFLKANVPAGADPALYDDFTFSRPFPGTFSKPIALVLTRNVGGVSETFYAIVWRIKQTAGSSHIYVGVEIDGTPPTGVSRITPVSFCNAVSTDKVSAALVHTPIPGLLQAQLTSSRDDLAFIRLHNSDKNKNAGYKPCKL